MTTPTDKAPADVHGLVAAVTVGGGLSVYGTHEAITRVQNYIMLDSTHPVEKEDVRRSLMRDLTAAESRLATLERELAEARAKIELQEVAMDDICGSLNDERAEAARLRAALEKCRDHLKRHHNASSWWNDPIVYELMTTVIEPALGSKT